MMEICDKKMKINSSGHPQTGESSEIMNQVVENYSRCCHNYQRSDLDELLPEEEFAYKFR